MPTKIACVRPLLFPLGEVVGSAMAAIVGPIFANAIILPIRGAELTTRKS